MVRTLLDILGAISSDAAKLPFFSRASRSWLLVGWTDERVGMWEGQKVRLYEAGVDEMQSTRV